jgi:hypothetical protein
VNCAISSLLYSLSFTYSFQPQTGYLMVMILSDRATVIHVTLMRVALMKPRRARDKCKKKSNAIAVTGRGGPYVCFL